MKTEVKARKIKDDEKKGQSIVLDVSLIAETYEDKKVIEAIYKSPEGASELGVVGIDLMELKVEVELIF